MDGGERKKLHNNAFAQERNSFQFRPLTRNLTPCSQNNKAVNILVSTPVPTWREKNHFGHRHDATDLFLFL
jgi:hypothetical protein